MKSRITWKGTLIILSILTLLVGTFRYAIGDITFPYIFKAGEQAIADQVNQNFAAINVRQAVTASNMAGNFHCKAFNVLTFKRNVGGVSVDIPCVQTMVHNLTITADGTMSDSVHNSSSCGGTNTPYEYEGTYTVNADGSGTANFSGVPTTNFQLSKDLNTLMWDMGVQDTNWYNNQFGVCMRI